MQRISQDNKFPKLFTLLVGLGTIVFMCQLLGGVLSISNKGYDLGGNLIILLASIISQIGFILSAFVLNKNILIKIGVILLMLPFFCYVVLHDLQAIYLYMLPIDRAALSWEYNFRNNLTNVLLCLVWLTAYSCNAARLLLSIRKKQFFNMSGLT